MKQYFVFLFELLSDNFDEKEKETLSHRHKKIGCINISNRFQKENSLRCIQHFFSCIYVFVVILFHPWNINFI